VSRHTSFEGGFSGRTNKLVDACYSFWMGAIFPLLNIINNKTDKSYLYDEYNLQLYIFICSQDEIRGGFRDKPGKSKDFYHTCYTLSGLSSSQHNADGSINILGDDDNNIIEEIHPLHNIRKEKADSIHSFFNK